eukprot:403344650
MTSPALIKLKSPKQEQDQNQLLSQENKSIFLSPKVINSQKNRHTVMSPEPVKNFSQQLELKVPDQKSIQNHHKSVKLTLKSQIIDENGQDALRLSSKFNRRVLIIRDQISDNKSHPLHKLIKRFDNLFFHQYAPQIERTNQKFVMKDSKEVMNRIVREVQSFVRILFFATIKFYRIELKPNDIRKDLIINMLTSVIMKDQTYSIIMNSILQGNQDRVKAIQKNMSKYKFKINLDKLGVSKYFQFSSTFRDLISTQSESTLSTSKINSKLSPYKQQDLTDLSSKTIKEELYSSPTRTKSQTFMKKRKNSYSRDNHKPFEKTIEALKEIPEINSPMKKLEFIYQVFNSLMIGEIDEFWDQVTNLHPRKLEIDYENLNGIGIYVALKAAIPILIIDIIFIENFVKENLPNYYEQKDKKNPLKENFTPKFITSESVLLSPRSMGASAQLSKLGQSFNQLSSNQTMQGYDDHLNFDPKRDEELLFFMEEVTLDSKSKKDGDSKQRRKSSEFEISQRKQSSFIEVDRKTSSNQTNNYQKTQCNIHPNAAKTIHKMLNQKLHLQSFIGLHNRHPSDNNFGNDRQTYNHYMLTNDKLQENDKAPHFSPQSHKQQLWNLNIYSDFDRLMSKYNEYQNQDKSNNQTQTQENHVLYDKDQYEENDKQLQEQDIRSFEIQDSPSNLIEEVENRSNNYDENTKIIITQAKE